MQQRSTGENSILQQVHHFFLFAPPLFLPVRLFYGDLMLHRLYNVFIINKVSDVIKHSVLTGCQLKIDIKCSWCPQQTSVRYVSTELSSAAPPLKYWIMSWWHNFKQAVKMSTSHDSSHSWNPEETTDEETQKDQHCDFLLKINK